MKKTGRIRAECPCMSGLVGACCTPQGVINLYNLLDKIDFWYILCDGSERGRLLMDEGGASDEASLSIDLDVVIR